MRKSLGPEQHKAWAYFITRHSKVFSRIERDLEGKSGILPLHQYDILLALKNADEGKLRLSEIADAIVTSRSALSRSVEKLEKLGLLVKEKVLDDGRGQFAKLTAAGRRALANTWPAYEQAIEEHFGQFLKNDDCRALIAILKNLDAANVTK